MPTTYSTKVNATQIVDQNGGILDPRDINLPTDAATASKQDIGNAFLTNIDSKTPALVGGRQPVDGSGVTQPISAVALPLPDGAATLSAQTSGNSLLSSLDSKFGTLGQKTAAGSAPVVIASNQSSIPVNKGATNATQTTVSVTTASTQILAANPDRKGFIITNVGTNTVYISFGAAPTTSIYAVSIQASAGNDRYEAIGAVYTGAINAVRGSGSTNVVVTEFS